MRLNTPGVLLILLVVHAAGAAAAQSAEAAAGQMPAPFERVEVARFSLAPAEAAAFQLVTFSAEVVNSGNVRSRAEPELLLYSGDRLLEAVPLRPLSLPAGGNATLAGDLIAPAEVGEYRVLLVVHYANRSRSASAEAGLRVTAERVRLPAGFKSEAPQLKFRLFPVVIEGRPGEAAAVSLTVANPSREPTGELRLRLEGIPGEWVTLTPGELSLGGNESAGVNIAISVPESALPGEHPLLLRVEGAGVDASAGFVFRIKPYPPEVPMPSVLRRVYTDGESRTFVDLILENSGSYFRSIEVVDELPPGVAPTAGAVSLAAADAAVEGSRIVWRPGEVDPYERLTLSYTVGHLSPDPSVYVHWPVLQVTAQRATAGGVEALLFSGAAATYTTPGREAEVSLVVTNPTLEALNVSIRLAAPPGWKVTPAERVMLLLPGVAGEATFWIRPPGDALPGSYTLTVVASGAAGEVSQPITVVLLEEEERRDVRKILLPLGALLAVVLLGYASIVIYRRRRAYRREVVEAVGRIKRSMEEE
ncbi:MAG: hypothetical protein GXO66_02360 [Euryarchaeota archaeon]|nr:hypothetical protein [Euryarchaeota archaeon]